MNKNKFVSSPLAKGGAGFHFENHVQACFVTLMLTRGYVPCFPDLPIVEIQFQSEIHGYQTDDLVVHVANGKKQRKLLVEIKRSINFNKDDKTSLAEAIGAAWRDFNNSAIFTKGKDAIALITAPLSGVDAKSVPWLLSQARTSKDYNDLIMQANQFNYSPPKSAEKLEVIRHHLKTANSGNDVADDEFYDFLNHFNLIICDIDIEGSFVLSLLHSHTSQIQKKHPQKMVWTSVVEMVQKWNRHSGTITLDNIPDNILEMFNITPDEPEINNLSKLLDIHYSALVALVGAWDEKNENDRAVLAELFGVSYDEWLIKAREILYDSDNSPLSIKNGVWKINSRAEIWNTLSSRLLDRDIEKFASLAVSVLKEPNPAFELPVEQRLAASFYGKSPKHSEALRKGIAEGLAILGSQPHLCQRISPNKVEISCGQVIHKLLTDANWIIWGSLNYLLPTLAEADPGSFLEVTEKAVEHTPELFDEFFNQEGDTITGTNYLSGLLWAMEGLAWNEEYLVRVCVALGKIADRDPGGQWSNRPFNSLSTILLPWQPQTLASVDKRKIAMKTLLRESPETAWRLLIDLLPAGRQSSIGSHKPMWRKVISNNRDNTAVPVEYQEQVSFYADLAVTVAGQDITRISTLIQNFNNLPDPAFSNLLQTLSSDAILGIPDEKRLMIWENLVKFAKFQRQHSNARWALSNELITSIEQVAEELAPANPFDLHRRLFIDNDIDLCERGDDLAEEFKSLDAQRNKAVLEIFEGNGIQGVIQFAELVSSPYKVGFALGAIADVGIEWYLLPNFLSTSKNSHKELVKGFIQKNSQTKGRKWYDNIEKTNWSVLQTIEFLISLPFDEEAWQRASQWLLKDNERKYWAGALVNPYLAKGDLTFAVDKLIENDRPYAAIDCLYKMLSNKQTIDSKQGIKALFAAISSNEPRYTLNHYYASELIKFLQQDPSSNKKDMLQVEWGHLSLLGRYSGSDATPKTLTDTLANDPEFFCKMIRLGYHSKNEHQPRQDPTEEAQRIAKNVWEIFDIWKTPPGKKEDGTYDGEHLVEWLRRVKEISTETGHLEISLNLIGNVLIHTPHDPDGLWIDRAAAAELNRLEHDDMRSGFRMGYFNSRGVVWVDPTGKPERELAEKYRKKADEAEDAGFQRLAATLRDLADRYDQEANSIIREHEQENIDKKADGDEQKDDE